MILAVGAIGIGIAVFSSFDLKSVVAGNDFFAAMLSSEGITIGFNRLKLSISILVAVVGVALGSISYGIGQLLALYKENTK